MPSAELVDSSGVRDISCSWSAMEVSAPPGPPPRPPPRAPVTPTPAALVVPVLVVERLQREAAMRLFAPAPTLRDVRVVLAHCLCLEDLQLRV
jgi:hypothetical protein